MPVETAQLAAAGHVLEPSAELEGWRIEEVLDSIPSWGPEKVHRALLVAGVPHRKRLGDLTPRQRVAVARVLGHPRAQEPPRALRFVEDVLS